ncbi:hypothetical protein M3Y99_01970700 [Aphelenchoides fujianensis]|nr:hypothetical protein M3Y99_01970700 [Aphelenchoides fujianensis]
MLPQSSLLLLAALLLADSATSSEFRRARQLFGPETVEDERCKTIMSSVNAQFFAQNAYLSSAVEVDEERPPVAVRLIEADEPADEAASEEVGFGYKVPADRSDRLERIARTLRSSVYAPKMCDPVQFHPFVIETGDASMSCFEICNTCLPGSAAVCHQRNKRFPGIAQSCFCTYDFDQPLLNAVLVLKNARHPTRFFVHQ